ncbi:hypothetical protein D3C85_1269290 [compost metagenome]
MHVGLGAVGETVLELVENAELTAHVVGGLGLVAKRRPTQHELLTGVLEQVRQVRSATGKLTDPWQTAQAWNMRLEVRVDQAGIEFFAGANTGGLVIQRHAYPFCLFWRPETIG